MDITPAIFTQHLSKHFDQTRAVDQISLTVSSSQVYALIGPNGAGKTTLIKLLVGLLIPTSGQAKVNGFDITTHPVAAKNTFGYVSDEPSAYEFLSGEEFLDLTAALRGMAKTTFKSRRNEIARIFTLDQQLTAPISTYSRGNRQKLAFLSAILTQPPLLIIDEPIVGLDPLSMEIFGKTLQTYAQTSRTVFFATHSLAFAQKYATYVGIMSQGKILHEQQMDPHTSLDELYRQLIQP